MEGDGYAKAQKENQEKGKETGKFVINYTVDSFANGIAFGQHRFRLDGGRGGSGGCGGDPRDHYALRIHDDADVVRLRSRYLFEKTNPLHELEHALMRLSRQGVLREAEIYFGVTTDPFLPFESKFDASMKFLDIFQRYTPGKLIVQTRSPLIVLALPVFKRLGKHASVTIGIETPCEDMVRYYTPSLPRVSERLRTVEAMRRFGIEVTLQVCPVLPYGEWREDAGAFAELLDANADYIHVKPLMDGSEQLDRRMKSSEIVRKLANERRFHYLRRDAAVPLLNAIEKVAPGKLKAPEWEHLEARQMEFFAA